MPIHVLVMQSSTSKKSESKRASENVPHYGNERVESDDGWRKRLEALLNNWLQSDFTEVAAQLKVHPT
jgi:hypothetical protein